MMMNPPPCPSCGSRDSREVSATPVVQASSLARPQTGVRYGFQCKACGLGFTHTESYDAKASPAGPT